MSRVYKLDSKGNYVNNPKSELIQFLVGIIVYALVLYIASELFEGFEITSFWYAIIGALILSFLNATLKPFLTFLTLPLTISTLGITYPLVNVIILYLCGFIMGKNFFIDGFLNVFFIAIFISLFKMFLDALITRKVK